MEEDLDTYVSLFGQQVSIQRALKDDDDQNVHSLAHLSLKGTRSLDHKAFRLSLTPTINSLPNEILMIIFQYLSRAKRIRPTMPAEHFTHQLWEARSMEPSPVQCDCQYMWLKPTFYRRLFPYAQEKVCSRWRAILGSSPAYFTRIVVSRVSGDWTHPKELEEYLRWTRALPIEVYVGKERNQRAMLSGFGVDKLSEQEMIAIYTQILKPHLWRCTVIDYEVQYSTSLPSVLHDFSGISEGLESLKLVCREECSPIPELASTRHAPAFNIATFPKDFPNLKALSLDGANFILVALNLPELTRHVQEELTIHHYHHTLQAHPHVDNLQFTTQEVISSLFPRSTSKRMTLTFKNVEFSPMNHKVHLCKDVNNRIQLCFSHPAFGADINIDWALMWLRCIDMSDHLLSEIIMICNAVTGSPIPENVDLENCTIRPLDSVTAMLKAEAADSTSHPPRFYGLLHIRDAPFSILPFAMNRLTLRNIHDPQSMINLFDRVAGCDVCIQSCPGLTDEVLSHLAGSNIEGHYHRIYDNTISLGIGNIEITDCAGYTPNQLWDAINSKVQRVDEILQQGHHNSFRPNSIWVEHPTIESNPTWETKFLQICTTFTWKYVPSGILSASNAGSDEVMYGTTREIPFHSESDPEYARELDRLLSMYPLDTLKGFAPTAVPSPAARETETTTIRQLNRDGKDAVDCSRDTFNMEREGSVMTPTQGAVGTEPASEPLATDDPAMNQLFDDFILLVD